MRVAQFKLLGGSRHLVPAYNWESLRGTLAEGSTSLPGLSIFLPPLHKNGAKLLT